MNKAIKILIIILVILLPLVNSRFFDLIGINFGLYVDGNYEFTKSIFFNILSGIILLLFFIKNSNKIIVIPNILLFLSGLLILSTSLSDFPLTSLFGESGKGHGAILFLNLIGLSIVFLNTKKKILKTYLKYSLYSIIFIILFGIKEYYFPTFDYGNLGNRAIGTFGHPNFLMLYILILFPLFIKNIKEKTLVNLNYFLIFLIIFTVLITQSIWGIFVIFSYIIFLGFNEYKNKVNKKNLLILIVLLGIIIGYIVIDFGIITKLNSFISRFYIWKTVTLIGLNNIKGFFIGHGFDALSYMFDTYKVPELYIFENFGYTSDRPHSLILNIFYHIGFIGCIIFSYLIFQIQKIIKTSKKNKYLLHSIFLFFIFTLFNFSSVSTYLIIVILLSIIFKEKNNYKNSGIFLPYVIIGILGIFGSTIYYLEESKLFQDKSYNSTKKYYSKLITENPEKNIFNNYFNYKDICKNLTQEIPSVENYFYCGNSLYKNEKELAINYYKKGLEKIPDMRDLKSEYYNNYFIKNIFVPGRFYSEKYNNLEEVLNRVGIKKEN